MSRKELKQCCIPLNRPSDRVREKKILRVLGGQLCGKKRRLCRNCVGLRNCVNKQIFDDRGPQKTPDMEEFLDKLKVQQLSS